MSKKKKKVVKTVKTGSSKAAKVKKVKRQSRAVAGAQSSEFIFGPRNYKFMLLGFGLIVIGLFLMAGGRQPSPDVWEPDVIYSFRRVTLAPLVILAGFAVEIYAIFQDKE